MIVVADSGPLRYLVLISEIHLLSRLFGTIVIPPGVVLELSQAETPVAVRQWVESMPAWAEVRSPHQPLINVRTHLGPGEREAIALALEVEAVVLLVDDGAARREATRRSIPVQGTLGILDLAAEHGLTDFPAALRRLQATNFRAGKKLIDFFLQRQAARQGNQSRV